MVTVAFAAVALLPNCRKSPTAAESREPTARTLTSTVPAVTAEVYRVGGDVAAPVLVKRVQPQFRESNVEYELGVLILKAVITKEGTVADVRIEHGPMNSYARAAIAAIRQWEYKPATRHGEPVAVELVITVNHFPMSPEA